MSVKKVAICVYIDRAVVERLDRLVDQLNSTRSAVVETAAKHWLSDLAATATPASPLSVPVSARPTE